MTTTDMLQALMSIEGLVLCNLYYYERGGLCSLLQLLLQVGFGGEILLGLHVVEKYWYSVTWVDADPLSSASHYFRVSNWLHLANTIHVF